MISTLRAFSIIRSNDETFKSNIMACKPSVLVVKQRVPPKTPCDTKSTPSIAISEPISNISSISTLISDKSAADSEENMHVNSVSDETED